jgi:hypothetical protein
VAEPKDIDKGIMISERQNRVTDIQLNAKRICLLQNGATGKIKVEGAA